MILPLLLAAAPATYTEYPVRLELSIDEAGKVVGCTILDPEAQPELAERSCKVALEKSRFTPARDASGKPIPARYKLTVRYRVVE